MKFQSVAESPKIVITLITIFFLKPIVGLYFATL